MKKYLCLIFSLLFFQAIYAVEDYEIKVQVKHYNQDQLILAHYLGSAIFVDDTARINQEGFFVFNKKKKLAAGIYLLVTPPENKYIEIFLTEEEKKYSLEFDANTLTEDVKFKNAPDNTLFYDYLKFMGQLRTQVDSLQKKIQAGKEAKVDVQKEEQKLKTLDEKLENYKENIIQKHPQAFTSTVLKSSRKIKFPTFTGTEEEKRLQEFVYRRQHFFDHVKDDPRFLRTKILSDMVDFYLDKLTFNHPDSVIQSVDAVLNTVSPDTSAFKSYFYNLINKYLQSSYMGMDAVYVHLVKNYTMKKRTPFFSAETNAKLTKDALLWEKTLIGKTAPDLKMFQLDIEGTIKVKDHEDVNQRFAMTGRTNLSDISKPFTVLVFWAPDCGHCKKSMPDLVDFYEKNQNFVEVFAICHTPFKQYPDCAVALKKYKAIKWINAIDPYYKYIKDYDIQKTPLILVLDENKEIMFKKIAVEKLEMALEELKLRKQK